MRKSKRRAERLIDDRVSAEVSKHDDKIIFVFRDLVDCCEDPESISLGRIKEVWLVRHQNMFTPKRQRTEGPSGSSSGGGGIMNSSQKILLDLKNGNEVDHGKSLKALCSCIIRVANDNTSNEEEYECLEELLQEGANPNYNEHSILEITGGTPIYLTIKLNVPKALELLLQHGALLTQQYDNKTPLQVSHRGSGGGGGIFHSS